MRLSFSALLTTSTAQIAASGQFEGFTRKVFVGEIGELPFVRVNFERGKEAGNQTDNFLASGGGSQLAATHSHSLEGLYAHFKAIKA